MEVQLSFDTEKTAVFKLGAEILLVAACHFAAVRTLCQIAENQLRHRLLKADIALIVILDTLLKKAHFGSIKIITYFRITSERE